MLPGSWEWLIILAVVVLLFGGSKLPKLGGALGESIKNFRRGISEAKEATPSLQEKNSSTGNKEHSASFADKNDAKRTIS